MRVSVICTVKNEVSSLPRLLDSLLAQTRPPDEVVVTDGGSTDGTVALLEGYAAHAPWPLRILPAPGSNIAQGRNEAIAAASGDIIASTDAGVWLEAQWLAELVAPLTDPAVQVVSGFFVPDPQTVFETALGATTLPTVEDVRPDRFIPSSRSVAFRKTAWAAVGGYPEWLDYCEDVIFDLALREQYPDFAWAPAALAHFRPRPHLRGFARQYYLYARGDGKAGLWPRRHAVRYLTYGIAAPLLAALGWRWPALWLGLPLGLAAMLFAPFKRLRRLTDGWPWRRRLRAATWVPLIRLTGDLAKMVGYPVGVWWRARKRVK
ncbi:MAG: glycosyltransferase [Anaerolineae bacterium]|nr:glycosyltransferase [Anaerolineae bacterium]